ncbi:hypothetical protein SALCHL_004630 [Streptomyces albus subsp. chlorinus]|nr:hypothetical protein [Streptomyces albus]
MIVTLIIACEIGFWVLLAAGLALRYLARMPRTGAAVLLCEPLLEVVLLVVTAIDLRNGAEPDWKHGLAAVYIGFTATHGHYMVRWADGHAAHLLGRGPRPDKAPRYGTERTVHEWKMAARGVGAAAIAAGLLQLAVWYVGDGQQSEPLRAWQNRMGVVAVISLLIAVSYTIWPQRPKDAGTAVRAGTAAREPEVTGTAASPEETAKPEEARKGDAGAAGKAPGEGRRLPVGVRK